MTIQQAQSLIRRLGLTARWMSDYREMRVDYLPWDSRFTAGELGSKYFTDDLQDAVATARVMARRES